MKEINDVGGYISTGGVAIGASSGNVSGPNESGPVFWILVDGTWNNSGRWDDNSTWID